MALYKKPCIHCGTLIAEDARVCENCLSHSPFGHRCPTCLAEIRKGQQLCSNCGRPLHVVCPFCGKHTFVQEKCEHCGGALLIRCTNRRCGAIQFFDTIKCTACGKKIKKRGR